MAYLNLTEHENLSIYNPLKKKQEAIRRAREATDELGPLGLHLVSADDLELILQIAEEWLKEGEAQVR